MAAKSPTLSPKSLKRIEGSVPRKGVRLTADTVFKLLKKTNKKWDWLAQLILWISSSKCREIAQRCSTADDCLMESIRFWMKRCPHASYRWIAFYLKSKGFGATSQEIHHLLEPDATPTSANLHSALASLNDRELRDVLGVFHDSREKNITEWMMIFFAPTWEWLAGRCFYFGKEKALEEVKKHFKKKLEPSLTATNLLNCLGDVKSWSDYGLPRGLQIPDSKVKKMEQLYPDPSQRQSALIQLWLNRHPAPSWELVCYALYRKEEYEGLENVQNKYFKGTSETRRQLKMAMKRGKGKTSITKVVLFGCAGSGKTCTMHVILEEDPPDEYTSTPLAVRPVKVYRVDMTPSQWKKLSRKEQDLVIAKACYSEEAIDLSQIPVELHAVPRIQQLSSDTSSLVLHDEGVGGHTSAQPMSSGATHTSSASSQDIAVRSKGEVTPALPPLETYNDLLSHMENCLADGAVVEIKRVQVSDCGGQPQFHEILPIFLRGTSLYIFVFKLDEELGARPMIKYHLDGKPICKPYECSESYEQILEHCLRVVRSQKATDEKSKPPRIMIIGTHKDKEHECTTETREMKNKRLAELLLPEFKKEVIYYRQAPSKQLVYALNAKNPGEEEKRTAEGIRLLVSNECAAEAVEIPLQWHALEGVLEDLAKAFKRDVLNKEECFAAAQSLHFEDESALDAALNYLDQLNLIFYYPDILPGVVFASAQVLLDKVTELVVAAHELRDGIAATAMSKSKMQDEKWQRFCDHALVSAEFLAQEDFQKHYKPGLFDHNNLILLFKKLLIFAIFNETEVFVPALLRRLKKEEIDKHRVPCSSSAASPLVLTFPKHGGPLLGVFCASVVALLSEDNIHPCPWNLKMQEDKITPSCLYRNCVQFTIPDYPGSVVVIDSFEYIEVHVHISSNTALKLKDFANFCQTVQSGIISAIHTATTALNYDYHKPSVRFVCPCNHPGLHVATITADSNLWICSINSDKCDEVTANQKVWFIEDKGIVSHKSTEYRPVPPSVAFTMNQQATSSDTTPALRTLDSTSEQSGSVTVDFQHPKDSGTPKNSQQRELDSTPQRSFHESSPTIRLVPQEGASATINPTPQPETSNVHIDSTPKLHQLGCLKLYNRRIKIIERVASKWESIATQLYFEGHLIDTIKIESHYQVDSACRKMFIKWLEGIGRQPATWRTLIDALDEAGLSRVAHELDNVINNTQESLFQGTGTTRRTRMKCNI